VEDMVPVDQQEQMEQRQEGQVPEEGNVFYADLTGLQYYVIPGYEGAVGGDGYVVSEVYQQPPQPSSNQIQHYRVPQQHQQQHQYPATPSHAHQQSYPQQQQHPQYQRAHVIHGAAPPLQKPVQHSTLTPTNSIQTPTTTSMISSVPDGASAMAMTTMTTGTELTILEPHPTSVNNNASNFHQQQQQCCQQERQECCQQRSFVSHHHVLPQPTLMCS